MIESNSWVGKAGGYDLAGVMGQHAKLIEGSEYTVLGFTQASLNLLTDLQSNPSIWLGIDWFSSGKRLALGASIDRYLLCWRGSD